MKFGRKPVLRKYTAKHIPRIPAPKITELNSQVDLREEETVNPKEPEMKTRILTEMHIEELLQELKPLTAKGVVAHRFSKESNTSIELMRRVLPLDDWQVQQENSGIKISALPMEGLGLPFIRGDGIIPGDYSFEEVLSVIQSAYARKFWDPRFDQAQVLEFLSPNSILVFSIQKGTFPVAARDLVTVTSVNFDEKEMLYVATSCKDDKAPSPGTGGRVRADLMLAGWRLLKSDKGIETTYIVHVDPKGSIPNGTYHLRSYHKISSSPNTNVCQRCCYVPC
jgi:hypothetical protein